MIAIVTLAHPSRADENLFGYVYGTETEPRGEAEIYQWVTSRSGKADGRYQAWDFDTEFEYGITDRMQVSFYLDASQHDIHGVPGLADANRLAWRGVQASLKYRLAAPDQGRLGVALYVEPGYARVDKDGGDATREHELETKLLLQKNLPGGRLVWAGNIIAELEREREPDGWADHLEFEFSQGLALRVAPNWFVGVENRWRSELSAMRFNAARQSGVFLGPSLHYDDKRWWFTVTVLPQIHGWPHRGASRLQLTENERLEIRLKVGLDL